MDLKIDESNIDDPFGLKAAKERAREKAADRYKNIKPEKLTATDAFEECTIFERAGIKPGQRRLASIVHNRKGRKWRPTFVEGVWFNETNKVVFVDLKTLTTNIRTGLLRIDFNANDFFSPKSSKSNRNACLNLGTSHLLSSELLAKKTRASMNPDANLYPDFILRRSLLILLATKVPGGECQAKDLKGLTRYGLMFSRMPLEQIAKWRKCSVQDLPLFPEIPESVEARGGKVEPFIPQGLTQDEIDAIADMAISYFREQKNKVHRSNNWPMESLGQYPNWPEEVMQHWPEKLCPRPDRVLKNCASFDDPDLIIPDFLKNKPA